jgi:hypothetical protein
MIKQLKDLSMFFFGHDSFTLHAIILYHQGKKQDYMKSSKQV